MPRIARRSIALFLAALVLAVAAPAIPPPAVAAAEFDVAQAERDVLGLINRDRASAGLVPVLVDARLATIARARSTDMATNGYFSHTGPDGRKVFDIIESSNITWYAAGEILASNNYPTLTDSASVANDGWLGSPTHRAVIMTPDYNYVGVGLAVDGAGNKLWTAVFLKGPDRTGAWSRMSSLIRGGTLAGRVQISVRWTGADVRLAALTAGLASYQLQRRTDGGSWTTVWSATTPTSLSGYFTPGHRQEFRVRARDRAGNYGAWTTAVGISV